MFENKEAKKLYLFLAVGSCSPQSCGDLTKVTKRTAYFTFQSSTAKDGKFSDFGGNIPVIQRG